MTTGKDGEAIVKGLTPGEYILTETKAPDGYVALKKPLAFYNSNGRSEDQDIDCEKCTSEE
ncbi:hypothetical protein BsIDN1_15400 [Bacillus safensis]|uniref:SpaA-like prealbumin fold domain-containing protein n=1 Tax=Bacillus safensis TaxID=561879 RepID=A0A5S9M5D7_BACIA|nr:hypothetical protein BsIDN1_15400 [Bacillus safensis]